MEGSVSVGAEHVRMLGPDDTFIISSSLQRATRRQSVIKAGGAESPALLGCCVAWWCVCVCVCLVVWGALSTSLIHDMNSH